MERCPNCGEMVRSGARYCTTCGYRMPDPPSDAASRVTNSDVPSPPSAPHGWPEYAPPRSESPDPSPSATSAPGEGEPDATGEAPGDASIASFWPAPAVAPVEMQSTDAEIAEIATVVADGSDVEETPEAGEIPGSPEREHVLALIDEVREFVVSIPNDDRDALRGVVAELEVASTTPGAFDPDELANLRDALLAARDRPRDLDTVLDLTRRIDSMVALVFAYERSHAAIERALDVLRRE